VDRRGRGGGAGIAPRPVHLADEPLDGPDRQAHLAPAHAAFGEHLDLLGLEDQRIELAAGGRTLQAARRAQVLVATQAARVADAAQQVSHVGTHPHRPHGHDFGAVVIVVDPHDGLAGMQAAELAGVEDPAQQRRPVRGGRRQGQHDPQGQRDGSHGAPYITVAPQDRRHGR
jgi:hypothetical protein